LDHKQSCDDNINKAYYYMPLKSHDHHHIIKYHFIFGYHFDSSSEFIPPAGSGEDVNMHERQPGVDDTPD